MSLERVAEFLCWGPLHEFDPVRLSAVVTIVRVVLLVSVRAEWIDGALHGRGLQEAAEWFRRALATSRPAASATSRSDGSGGKPLPLTGAREALALAPSAGHILGHGRLSHAQAAQDRRHRRRRPRSST
jgi:hypothetical protein